MIRCDIPSIDLLARYESLSSLVLERCNITCPAMRIQLMHNRLVLNRGEIILTLTDNIIEYIEPIIDLSFEIKLFELQI